MAVREAAKGCLAAATVVLMGCGGETNVASPPPSSSSAPARTSSPTATPTIYRSGKYHVVGQPLIFYLPVAPSGSTLSVYVRLNRRLPKSDLEGGGRADFSVDSSPGLDALPERVGRASRYCYSGILNSGERDSLAHPRNGQRVTLSIDVGQDTEHIEVPAALRGPIDAHRGYTPRRQRALAKALCGTTPADPEEA